MMTYLTQPHTRHGWRLLAAAALLLALIAAPAASAEETGPGSITLYAPGAPAGAWSVVQWQDGAGTWHTVEGWQGHIDFPSVSGLPYKSWVVLSDLFGRGPFRWVVYTQPGGSVWATSASFTMPSRTSSDIAVTVTGSRGPAPAAPPAASPAPATTAKFASEELACRKLFCGYSLITVYANGAPSTAWVSVQWLDPQGNWRDVEGWQSSIDFVAVTNQPYERWVVFQTEYGRGPFRWVVYTRRGGSVWGASPNFHLPEDGIHLSVTLSH